MFNTIRAKNIDSLLKLYYKIYQSVRLQTEVHGPKPVFEKPLLIRDFYHHNLQYAVCVSMWQYICATIYLLHIRINHIHTVQAIHSRIVCYENIKRNCGKQINKKPSFKIMNCYSCFIWNHFIIFWNVCRA